MGHFPPSAEAQAVRGRALSVLPDRSLDHLPTEHPIGAAGRTLATRRIRRSRGSRKEGLQPRKEPAAIWAHQPGTPCSRTLRTQRKDYTDLVKGPSNSSETSVNTTPSDFDELTYLEYNPDVCAAVMQGAISCGYEHWIEHGQQEGRLSSTRAQPVQGNAPPDWNELRYLRNNPDVAAAVRSGIYSSGYDHWIQHGEQEARIGAAGRVFHKTTDLKTALRKHPPGFNYFSFQSVAIGLGWAARGYIGVLKAFGPKVTTIDLAWGGAPSDGPAGVAATPKNPYAINFFHFNPDILPNFLHQMGEVFSRPVQHRCMGVGSERSLSVLASIHQNVQRNLGAESVCGLTQCASYPQPPSSLFLT